MDSTDRLSVLGIEGTAWAASAAVFETPDPGESHDEEHVFVESDPYQPESGGIHPREAAEHMAEAIPAVVERAMDHARERAADSGEGAEHSPIDAVAFSRGPGLGPCLRIAGTAARSVAGRQGVPLVGVNHMVAHLEIGRHFSGFADPVCLNASGANAHVLAYRNGRYRVLGETMDAGVGNALDKFTRHLGWQHPGGPKIEERAKSGEYVDLPYVVKGMDFSFSGLASAAKQAVDEGTPIEDVCRGLQETVFAMLAEVSERALSLTGSEELVLGGGVGQNACLREMLASMCAQRGAEFFAPPAEFLRDNAGMIAVLGAKMYAASDTLAIEDSRIDADFRPDQVPVTWREDEGVGRQRPPLAAETTQRGAEATVSIADDTVTKERRPREYRHPALDERLRRERTRSEARLTSDARRAGVPTPVLRDVDPQEARLVMEAVGARDLGGDPTEARVRTVARHLAACHTAGLVHGDPTVRNVRVGRWGDDRQRSGDGPESTTDGRTYLVDFGLGYYSREAEDHAMDLHVFAQSLEGTVDDADALVAAAVDAYRDAAVAVGGDAEAGVDPDAVLARLRAIEGRGRYQ